MTASRADITFIKFDFITPSENIEEARIHFRHRYYYPKSGHTLSWTTVSYFSALKIFRTIGQEKTARLLENRVKELIPETDRIKEECAEVRQVSQSLKRKIIGPDLAKHKVQFESEKYKTNPIDVFLCELNARENGKEYRAPSPAEFLKRAAESLARFEEPFRREEYLITPQDLKNLHLILTKRGHQHLAEPKQMKHTIGKLEKNIAEFSEGKTVKLTLIETEDLPDEIENMQLCKGCNPLMKLQIDETVRYLRYHCGVNPFQFLKKKKQDSPEQNWHFSKKTDDPDPVHPDVNTLPHVSKKNFYESDKVHIFQSTSGVLR